VPHRLYPERIDKSLSTTSRSDDIFPLPLTPFEQAMVIDDRRTYPMNCGAEFVFRGEGDPRALQSAFKKAVARHPMLRAGLHQDRRGGLSWVRTDRHPTLEWLNTDQPNSVFANPQPFDLYSEAPLRLWIVADKETTRLQFEWHHACFDAVGGMLLIEDLFVAYDNEVGSSGKSVHLRVLDENILAKRGGMSIAAGQSFWKRVVATWKDYRKSLHLSLHPPIPLAVPATQRAETAARGTRYIVEHFDFEFLRSLRHVASGHGATFNDFVVHQLFVVLNRWNKTHGLADPRSHIRVVLPMSLRGPLENEMSAANCLSYAFVTRSHKQVSSDVNLLEGIRNETESIRRYLLPVNMLKKLAWLNRLGMNMESFFRDDSCSATALLTNLGDPTRRFYNRFPREDGYIRVGNMLLENIVGIAPLRPLTRAVFDIFTYANRLSVALRCDPHCFNEVATRQLLDAFLTQLRTTAEQADTAAQPLAV